MSSSILRTLGLSAVALALLAGVACAGNQTAGEVIDDAAITTKVTGKLTADPDINPFRIDVDTVDGEVRLSGTVLRQDQVDAAIRHARETKGVKNVVNDLTVGEKTIGESFDDAAITTKIKAKLAADPMVNPFDIDVDVEKHVVTLSGVVETRAQRSEAVKLAWGTEGVIGVRNRLKVEPDDD